MIDPNQENLPCPAWGEEYVVVDPVQLVTYVHTMFKDEIDAYCRARRPGLWRRLVRVLGQ